MDKRISNKMIGDVPDCFLQREKTAPRHQFGARLGNYSSIGRKLMFRKVEPKPL